MPNFLWIKGKQFSKSINETLPNKHLTLGKKYQYLVHLLGSLELLHNHLIQCQVFCCFCDKVAWLPFVKILRHWVFYRSLFKECSATIMGFFPFANGNKCNWISRGPPLQLTQVINSICNISYGLRILFRLC